MEKKQSTYKNQVFHKAPTKNRREVLILIGVEKKHSKKFQNRFNEV